MFGSSADPGQNNCAVAGTVLIPTRFVWRYGGRRVFLSGSFTGWSEHILMSPMEGYPTVFQVICNLTPGYHQFKFNVDGEWRHDEHQDFVSGSYGIVNTVFLARDSEPLVPVVFTTETPGRFNMEVDDTFMRMGISDGISSEVAPTISATDIEVSRHRISLFLSQHTAYELLIESGKVVALDVNLPVKQAFHILYEQLGNHGSNLTEEELETYTILDWKDGKSHIIRQIDGDGGLYPRRLIHVRTYNSLKDVALKILQNKVSTVPVIHSSSPDGSYPQLLHLASLSGILKLQSSYRPSAKDEL